MVVSTDASGATTTQTTNENNETTTVVVSTDASGATTTQTTNANNEITTVVVSTDESGNDVVETTDSDGVVTTVTTDENNEITTVEESTDENGNNVVETTLPSGVVSVITTEPTGKITTTTVAVNGSTTIVEQSTDTNGNQVTETTTTSGVEKRTVLASGIIEVINTPSAGPQRITKYNNAGGITETDDPELLNFVLPSFAITVPDIVEKASSAILENIDTIFTNASLTKDVNNIDVLQFLGRSIPTPTLPGEIPEFAFDLPTNNLDVANVLLDQLLVKNSRKTVKMSKSSIPLPSFITTAIEDFDLCVAKTNSTISFKDSEVNLSETAVYCPITDVGGYVTVELTEGNYTIQKTSDTYFSLKLGNETIGTTYESGDVYNTDYNMNIAFGSATFYGGDGSDNDSSSNEIPCFLYDTNILTTTGYKKVQELTIEDVLIDAYNKHIFINEIEGFMCNKHPYKIPNGRKIGSFTCEEDLYITNNHCVYHDKTSQYVPSSMISKKITKEDNKYTRKSYQYFHIYTNNYFTDTIIANGVPCETHSKVIFTKLFTNYGESKAKQFLSKLFNKLRTAGIRVEPPTKIT